MVIRELQVEKRARTSPIHDQSAKFPSLDIQGLRLDLLEFERKRNAGLPPISTIIRSEPMNLDNQSVASSTSSRGTRSTTSKSSVRSTSSKGSSKSSSSSTDMNELADDDESPSLPPPISEDGEDEGGEEEEEEVEEEEDAEEGEEEEALGAPKDKTVYKSQQEVEEEERQEYIWRWKVIKKQYPNADLPEFSEFSDVSTMKSTYDRTLKELYLDDCVENYRTYLVGGMMALEYGCTHWLGIDMSGFLHSQVSSMERYDRLLLELGEKSYSRWAMNLPVEVRLLGTILMQGILFYLGKMIAAKSGDGVADMIMGIFRGSKGTMGKTISNTQPRNENEQQERPKMRGPSISAKEINKRAQKPPDDVEDEVDDD